MFVNIWNHGMTFFSLRNVKMGQRKLAENQNTIVDMAKVSRTEIEFKFILLVKVTV